MPKYTVRYECREYYEKVYEAISHGGAEQMFYDDDMLFQSSPYDSDVSLIEVVDEDEECEVLID